jgi:phosphoribosylformimino-5-aminoimidazole carboxamide ribotide isomerase
MNIIPVIDLKQGKVVRAARGERHLYAPIETPLSATSWPVDVVAGFRALDDFRTIYIADLDAIEGRGDHASDIAELEREFPSVSFWVDAGIAEASQARDFLRRHRSELVLGSETLRAVDGLVSLMQEPALANRLVLSLDFRGEAYQGPGTLIEQPAFWPARLIVMTLARVGSNAGPDFDRLRDIATLAGARRAIYAAGGVRGPQDLAALQAAGIEGVLIASALHDGRLDAATLKRFHG